MLASIVASKTARLITACVCPVVGAGTLTMAVPKVRNAVHKATAPREYALPKTRERLAQPVAAPAPCTVIGATPLSAGYIEDVPSPLYPFPTGPVPVPGTPIVSLSYGDSPNKVPIAPTGGAVPEPHIWLQFLIGFTLVGGAVRMARKRPTEEEEKLLDRVEDLKRQA